MKSAGWVQGKFSDVSRLGSRMLRDNQGATAIEYALIAGGISIAIAVVAGSIGTQLAGFFATIPGWFGG